MEPWKKIDTAPLNTRILLRYGDLDGHVEDGFVYDDSDDGHRYYVLFDGDSLDSEPTQWLPMPPNA